MKNDYFKVRLGDREDKKELWNSNGDIDEFEGGSKTWCERNGT